MNLREPTSVVRKIELFEASPNPFTLRTEDSHTVPPLNPDEYLKQLNQVRWRFVRVTLAPYMFTVTRMIIVQNLLALGERSAATRRPSFAVLQVGSEQKYGLFSIGSQENREMILFLFLIENICLTPSNTKARSKQQLTGE